MKVTAAALTGLIVGAQTLATPQSQLRVQTTSGRVTGFINSAAPDVAQWLGVPFAEPPVDTLRFLPPVRKHYAGDLITTAYQPACMQQTSSVPTLYTEYLHEFLINGGQSEDCLYLNVYAPLNPTEKNLPVFIYVHGGGYTSGGTNSLYKIPDKWVQSTQSHIVVTIAYRVNIFGQPNAKGQYLNVGLLDQRLAVEWCRDNIARFNGDPSRMVLWGQSAGAGSVGLYSYAYPFDPIVSGLIADSGGANIISTPFDYAHSNFTYLAGLAGCGGLNAADELRCMQKVNASTLAQLVSNTSSISFSPVADNVTRFANVTERARAGLLANLPMITGNNANEGASFGTFNASGESRENYEIGLSAITCPVASEVRNRIENGFTTYRYLYSGNFSNISPLPWVGAAHSAELPLIFNTHWEYRGNSTQYEYEVGYAMQDLWLAFARNSSVDPTNRYGFTWPKDQLNSKTMAVFAANGTINQLGAGAELVDWECA
ncbi:Carboxylic ester hydrolase [Aspergillus mulundensis]|uniref:Carboxylic ester hydrolase n=1 Tax=Aspergillus mulundensis TaxID=1810919 RepID=A0A3D8RSF6_9EURO|nr:Carboxylic ester hydrolase [Aspergillus mulundensis]RDW76898.1 Carboxylic ester hydrolase [Aspergillus mulundensis]